MGILTFLGITVGLIASMVTIIVGLLQIATIVHRQKRRKGSIKRLAVIETQKKEAPKAGLS